MKALLPQNTLFEETDSAAQETEFLSHAGQEERGAIFTKKEVVCFILDLVGYNRTSKLYRRRILEPSFGHGDFLIEIIDRLLHSYCRDLKTKNPSPDSLRDLKGALRAVELHQESFQKVQKSIRTTLSKAGFSPKNTREILKSWLHQGDFLFTDFEGLEFDFVVGNPPYVRQEMIPNALLKAYRERFSTMYDRADLYVPFIECSLGLLRPKGKLGFICADRWIKNKYGQPLRQLVSARYSLTHYVSMTGVEAFHSEVTAYPAVTVISRTPGKNTRIAKPEQDLAKLRDLSRRLRARDLSRHSQIQELTDVVCGNAPWILTDDPKTRLLRKLERELPLFEETGCRVGIGVATGADRVFIGTLSELDVEPSRKLPLAVTRDVVNGEIAWSGKGVVNPFLDDGSLAPFEEFPKMAKFFLRHEKIVKGRNVAKKNRTNWYRTIDRIYPALTACPKLLIPDIRGDASIVLENQGLYPHHNFYYVTSNEWDLKALQAVLLSGLARLFVAAYTTKMRGGFLRYQAQYLRRIRLPRWETLGSSRQKRLISAAARADYSTCGRILAEFLNLSASEISALEEPNK